MVALEEGPFSIFLKLREHFPQNKGWVGRGLACPMCISFWVAMVFAAWWFWPWLAAGVAFYIVAFLALSGAVVIIYRLVG
jgi:hypothetical protein